MILLCLIGRKETYGYEIITELNNSASVLGYAKEMCIRDSVQDEAGGYQAAGRTKRFDFAENFGEVEK